MQGKSHRGLSPLTIGMLAGAALGAVAMSMSSGKARRAVKRTAGRAIDSVEDFAGEMTSKFNR